MSFYVIFCPILSDREMWRFLLKPKIIVKEERGNAINRLCEIARKIPESYLLLCVPRDR